MTREEAIRIIKEGLCYLRCANGCNMDECKANCEYKEVVEVLEQEPKIYINGDMSAKILEYFKDINHAYNDCTRYDTLKRMIDELQEPKLIPVSERLPEKDDLYLIIFDDGEYELVYFGNGAFSDTGVIAWMPLPEPYKTESEVKE